MHHDWLFEKHESSAGSKGTWSARQQNSASQQLAQVRPCNLAVHPHTYTHHRSKLLQPRQRVLQQLPVQLLRAVDCCKAIAAGTAGTYGALTGSDGQPAGRKEAWAIHSQCHAWS